MKLLVSKREYHHLWEITSINEKQEYKIKPVKLDDFSTAVLFAPGPKLTPQTLPTELIVEIIKETINICIAEKDYEQANLLCSISKTVLSLVYNQVYGKGSKEIPQISFTEMHMRISRGFKFVQSIFDDYLTCVNEDDFAPVLLGSRTTRSGFLLPWNFHEVHELDLHTLESHTNFNHGPVFTLNTGPLFGDIVWCFGKDKYDIIDDAHYYHPIITINLCNAVGSTLPTRSSFSKNFYFRRFALFIKICFGGKAGVFFVTKHETMNPFRVENELLNFE